MSILIAVWILMLVSFGCMYASIGIFNRILSKKWEKIFKGEDRDDI